MRVVGYARLSPRPEEGLGIDVQTKKMESYAKLYDLDLVEIRTEPELVTGKNLDRPALQEVLGMLKGGFVGGVLVAKLDRLSRSIGDMAFLVEEYFASNYALFSVAEQVNTKTANGRMVLHFFAMVAQWEREVIGERTKEALAHLKDLGVDIGRAPYGYEYAEELDENGRRVIREVPEELDALEIMRFYRERGHTLADIAKRLNAAGHKTKRSGEWHAGTVCRILKRERRKKKRTKRRKKE